MGRKLPSYWPEILSELYSSIKQAVIVADLDGNILAANETSCQLLGYGTSELDGQELSLLFTEEDLVFFYPNIMYLAKGGRSFEGEVMLKNKEGDTFFAFLIFKSFPVAHEDTTLIGVSFHNIDRQKQFDRLLRETHFEDLVKVANGIAHELRNPLTGIGGLVNRLYKTCQESPSQQKYYEFILSNVKRIEAIVKNIERLANLPKPVFKPESIRDIFESATESFLPRAKEKNVEIIIESETDPVYLDKNLMKVALSILIENALDAIINQGRITLSSECDGKECKLTVSDTGTGIKPDDLPFLFVPFFSTKADGTGIDLSIVKRIVESHGGRLSVQSTLGKGSAVSLELPLERRRKIRIDRLSADDVAAAEA